MRLRPCGWESYRRGIQLTQVNLAQPNASPYFLSQALSFLVVSNVERRYFPTSLDKCQTTQNLNQQQRTSSQTENCVGRSTTMTLSRREFCNSCPQHQKRMLHEVYYIPRNYTQS